MAAMIMAEASDFSPSVRNALRSATAASHEALDSEFGALDLTRQNDFARFLAAHYIGLKAMFPLYRRFVSDDLGMTPPDYPAMLRGDLAATGRDVSRLPVIEGAKDLDPLAVTYVLAGSRLGLTMLARQDYWGRTDARASAYMADANGIGVWKSLLRKMDELEPDESRMASITASANAAFLLFRRAFALSNTMAPASL